MEGQAINANHLSSKLDDGWVVLGFIFIIGSVCISCSGVSSNFILIVLGAGGGCDG